MPAFEWIDNAQEMAEGRTYQPCTFTGTDICFFEE